MGGATTDLDVPGDEVPPGDRVVDDPLADREVGEHEDDALGDLRDDTAVGDQYHSRHLHRRDLLQCRGRGQGTHHTEHARSHTGHACGSALLDEVLVHLSLADQTLGRRLDLTR